MLCFRAHFCRLRGRVRAFLTSVTRAVCALGALLQEERAATSMGGGLLVSVPGDKLVQDEQERGAVFLDTPCAVSRRQMADLGSSGLFLLASSICLLSLLISFFFLLLARLPPNWPLVPKARILATLVGSLDTYSVAAFRAAVAYSPPPVTLMPSAWTRKSSMSEITDLDTLVMGFAMAGSLLGRDLRSIL